MGWARNFENEPERHRKILPWAAKEWWQWADENGVTGVRPATWTENGKPLIRVKARSRRVDLLRADVQ